MMDSQNGYFLPHFRNANLVIYNLALGAQIDLHIYDHLLSTLKIVTEKFPFRHYADIKLLTVARER